MKKLLAVIILFHVTATFAQVTNADDANQLRALVLARAKIEATGTQVKYSELEKIGVQIFASQALGLSLDMNPIGDMNANSFCVMMGHSSKESQNMIETLPGTPLQKIVINDGKVSLLQVSSESKTGLHPLIGFVGAVFYGSKKDFTQTNTTGAFTEVWCNN